MFGLKKLSLIGMTIACSFSLLLQASNVNHQKTAHFGRVATLITLLTPAPFVLGYSLSKLQLAKKLGKEGVAIRIAQSLQKRGYIGLAVGTVLTAPHIMSLKIAHDLDKPQQETINTTPANSKDTERS